MARGILVGMEELRHEPDLPVLKETGPDRDSDRIPKPFPLIRYYLIASVLLVIGAFAIINFSTQRIQSDTVIDHLREEAGRDVEHVLFEISLAITSTTPETTLLRRWRATNGHWTGMSSTP